MYNVNRICPYRLEGVSSEDEQIIRSNALHINNFTRKIWDAMQQHAQCLDINSSEWANDLECLDPIGCIEIQTIKLYLNIQHLDPFNRSDFNVEGMIVNNPKECIEALGNLSKKIFYNARRLSYEIRLRDECLDVAKRCSKVILTIKSIILWNMITR